MTKQDCESRITELVHQIADTLNEFDPDCFGFTCFWCGNHIVFFNDYDRDHEKRVDVMFKYREEDNDLSD